MANDTNKKDSFVLTGVKPTGIPHIGNYIGAIKPMIESANSNDFAGSFVFIADYHALNGLKDAKLLNEYTINIASIYMALGLDTNKSFFYRQSDIPEVFELSTILNAFTAKGLMNRAHAYKAAFEQNNSDEGINMGLYTYPILMAADIVLFGVGKKVFVPVGKDQVQHIEIARDIVVNFNQTYKQEIFKHPEALIQKDGEVLVGTDGRKMSKSYGNVIPIFGTEKEIKSAVMGIKTDSRQPSEPKPDYKDISIYQLYTNFASETEISEMAYGFKNGKLGYGDAKKLLLEAITKYFKPYQEKYLYYKNTEAGKKELFDKLENGSQSVRKIAKSNLNQLRKIIGIN